MITVKIKSTFAFGKTGQMSKQILSGENLHVEVEQGTCIEELLLKMPWLGPPEEYDDLMLVVFVNGKLQPYDYILTDNDELNLHIPIGGG